MSNHLSISRQHVTGIPLGEVPAAVGSVYRFPANATDFAALPELPWTTAHLGPVVSKEAEPALYRAASLKPGLMIEIETVSDSGSRTMKAEAEACWRTLGGNIKSRVHWMRFIGLHPHIQDRASEPTCERRVTVKTLQDDFLAKLFAGDNAALARIAMQLHVVEVSLPPEPDRTVSFEAFFWEPEAKLEPWSAQRYDEALADGFSAISSPFAPQEK